MLAAADERAEAVRAEWESLAPLLAAEGGACASWTQAAFADSLAVVLSTAILLPAADCFALLPLASTVCRRQPGPDEPPPEREQFGPAPPGAPSALLDFDAGRGAALLLATRPIPARGAVVASDAQQRNRGELLLGGGESAAQLAAPFPGDSITWSASLLPADRLYSAKVAALEAVGLAPAGQPFPVFSDRMPTQLLAYLRLSRVTEVAELARVRFDADAVVSELNEYEVLQLMLADCRERLNAYAQSSGDGDARLLALPGFGPRERAAAQLRLGEKQLLNETIAGIRRRLAPIRGSPTKGGRMQANHSDILEVFEAVENWQRAPSDILKGFLGWDDKDAKKKDGCS